MGLTKRDNSPYHQYSFKIPGQKRQRGSTRYKDKVLAQKKLDLLKAAAQQRHDFGDPVDWNLDKILEYAWAHHWSRKPRANREKIFTALSKFRGTFGKLKAAHITTQQILDYRFLRETNKKKPIKTSSTNREFNRIRRAYKLAIKAGLLSRNPMDGIEHTDEKRFKRDRVANLEEQAYLFDRSEGMFHFIIRFALETGMRKGEIENLKKNLVDFDNGEIKVTSWKGKGDAPATRYIPINPEALIILRQMMLHPYENVFHNGTGRQIPMYGLIHSAWPRLVKSIGIKNLRFHDLRHTFATELWRKTKDILLVHKILGHEKLETTLRYLNLNKLDLRSHIPDAVSKHEILNPLKTIDNQTSAVSSVG